MPKGRKVSPEQIVVTLRQIEVQLAQGKSLALACKEAGLSEQTPGRMPERRDLLQPERGASRDRGLEGPRQSDPAPLGPGLPATCTRDPRLRPPPTHAIDHAVVLLNPVQNPGQVTMANSLSSRQLM